MTRRPLTDIQTRVMLQYGTEPPGSSHLNAETREGVYLCAACGETLFHSSMKYESHCGWPAFTNCVSGAVETANDDRYGISRVEIHCARCKGHLGHLFKDGPAPTGLRYCINGVALNFVAGASSPPSPTVD